MPEPVVPVAAAVNPPASAKVKRRRAWIAGLLAVIHPGLGHLYGGKPALALLIQLGPLVWAVALVVVLTLVSVFYPRSVFLVAMAVIVASYVLFWLWQLASACLLARRQSSSYRLAWYNHFLVYAAFSILMRLVWVPPWALPSGESYVALYYPARNGRRPSLPPVAVEADHVYLLGDNRDNSRDSRHDGQVSAERVAGRATVIWFSYSGEDLIR